MHKGRCLLCRAYGPWLLSVLRKIPAGRASIPSPDQTWHTINLLVLALEGRRGDLPRVPETMGATRGSLAEGNHILAPVQPPFPAPARRQGRQCADRTGGFFAHSLVLCHTAGPRRRTRQQNLCPRQASHTEMIFGKDQKCAPNVKGWLRTAEELKKAHVSPKSTRHGHPVPAPTLKSLCWLQARSFIFMRQNANACVYT